MSHLEKLHRVGVSVFIWICRITSRNRNSDHTRNPAIKFGAKILYSLSLIFKWKQTEAENPLIVYQSLCERATGPAWWYRLGRKCRGGHADQRVVQRQLRRERDTCVAKDMDKCHVTHSWLKAPQIFGKEILIVNCRHFKLSYRDFASSFTVE